VGKHFYVKTAKAETKFARFTPKMNAIHSDIGKFRHFQNYFVTTLIKFTINFKNTMEFTIGRFRTKAGCVFQGLEFQIQYTFFI